MDKFPKLTNQWLEEEVDMPVMTPHVDEEHGRVEFKQENKKVKQRTFYADSPPKKITCAKHFFISIDIHKYLFGCRDCDWRRIAFPITYRFDPKAGTLTHRKTGQVL